jgi:REP-associated tyrosine transposase
VQPGSEIGPRLEPAQLAIRLEEGLLDYILSVLAAASEPIRDVKDVPRVALDERLKRVSVAVHDLRDGLAVALVHPVNIDGKRAGSVSAAFREGGEKGPAPLVTSRDKLPGTPFASQFPHSARLITARNNRCAPPGQPYHVVNRGNDRRLVFLEPAHYKFFTRLLRAGTRRFGVVLDGYCAMRNHFHLILEPTEDRALSEYMQWVTGCYSCYFRTRTRTLGHGHVFQRRFWSAPIHDDLHFLTVLRYVEANPVRATLVRRAEQWEWSSLTDRLKGRFKSERCDLLPSDWCDLVNSAQSPDVLERLRKEIAPRPGRPAKT